MIRSPLKRHVPLHRRVGVRRFNPQRRAKRRARDFAEQADLCRRMPCCVCYPVLWSMKASVFAQCPNMRADLPSHPHHEPPRSIGGRDRDTVPLCFAHHRERHVMGRDEFEEKYGLDLRGLAAHLHSLIARAAT